jgi:hypothetical protein
MPSSYTTNYSWILPEIGSDTDAWGAHLNYNFGDATNGIDKVVKDISNVANAALPRAGGTVTGAVTFSGGSTTLTMGAPIILAGNPTSANHASSKAYVDAGDSANATAASNAQATANAALARSGGTMTGFITLHESPSSNFHAATKIYVDATDADRKTYVDSQDDLKLNLAGGSMSGFLTLHASPTSGSHAATKSYTDAADALKLNLTGGTLSGFLTLHDAPSAALHAATKGYVDAVDVRKLNLAGGTMTGVLAFAAGQPTATTSAPNIVQLQDSVTSTSTTLAATPNSVKTAYDLANAALSRGGGTMTGKITLDSDPSADLHAVPRQYVTAYAQPIDADLTAIASLSGTGLARRTGTNTWTLDANAYLTGNQSISLSGDASGSGATSIAVTLANTGVNAGTYTKLTVDSKGRATSGTTLSAGDIPTLAASKISDFDAQVRTSRLDQMSAPTASVSLNSQRITSLADPSASSDAATRNYVDTTRLSVTGGTLSGNLTIQNGSAQMALTLGNSGGFFYGDGSNAGWFKSGGAHVRWNQASGNFDTTGTITSASSISGTSISATNGSVTASTSISAGTTISAGTSISAASGSISGALSIGTQSAGDHATRKDYVDSAINGRLSTGGGTLTGNLTIENGSPTILFNDTDQGDFAVHCNSNLIGFTNNPVTQFLFSIDTAGNVTAKENVTAYSDERLKTDICTIDYALDKLKQLRGVTYRRKETLHPGMGVIAQEVRDVIPEVVHVGSDGILSVAYGNLVGLLIEAVKELEARVEELEAR